MDGATVLGSLPTKDSLPAPLLSIRRPAILLRGSAAVNSFHDTPSGRPAYQTPLNGDAQIGAGDMITEHPD